MNTQNTHKTHTRAQPRLVTPRWSPPRSSYSSSTTSKLRLHFAPAVLLLDALLRGRRRCTEEGPGCHVTAVESADDLSSGDPVCPCPYTYTCAASGTNTAPRSEPLSWTQQWNYKVSVRIAPLRHPFYSNIIRRHKKNKGRPKSK